MKTHEGDLPFNSLHSPFKAPISKISMGLTYWWSHIRTRIWTTDGMTYASITFTKTKEELFLWRLATLEWTFALALGYDTLCIVQSGTTESASACPLPCAHHERVQPIMLGKCSLPHHGTYTTKEIERPMHFTLNTFTPSTPSFLTIKPSYTQSTTHSLHQPLQNASHPTTKKGINQHITHYQTLKIM
jgi:hypothetical protein